MQARLMGIQVDNLTMDEALERLAGYASTGQGRVVSFLNAHCANVARRDPAYRLALAESDLVLPDGSGVRLAGSVLGQPIRANVNGTDLFPRLCARLEREGRSLYLLGAAPKVAEGVVAWLRRHHPDLRVAGWRHGYFAPDEEARVVEEIAAAAPDVLLVALGVPRQELFLARHRAPLGARVALAVGGLFDFYSGRLPRAPLALRRLGMEWSWRLAQEPRRLWRRYLVGNLEFLAQVLLHFLKT